jgi:hypothetical protein
MKNVELDWILLGFLLTIRHPWIKLQFDIDFIGPNIKK